MHGKDSKRADNTQQQFRNCYSISRVIVPSCLFNSLQLSEYRPKENHRRQIFVTDTNIQLSADALSTQSQEEPAVLATSKAAPRAAIWTPPFLLIFSFTLVFGIGIASIVTHIWTNSTLYTVDQVGMIAALLLSVVWLATIGIARSRWMRLGALFSLLWAVATLGQFWLSKHGIASQSVLQIQIHTVENSALLAGALCLSVGRTRLKRRGTIFFWLLPILFCAYLAYAYLKEPADTRSLLLIQEKFASLALYASIAIWWLRPSCWRDQPGPAFLFGLAAVILFLLNRSGNLGTEQNVFFLQIFFLCHLLAAARVLQGERRTHATGQTFHVALPAVPGSSTSTEQTTIERSEAEI